MKKQMKNIALFGGTGGLGSALSKKLSDKYNVIPLGSADVDISKIEEVKVNEKYKVELIYSKYSPDNLSDLSLFKDLKIKDYGKKKFDELDIIGAGPYKFGKVQDLSFRLLPINERNRSPF